ncbi:sulfatase [Vallitalea okinawensis]|uniref:sulfatase n=1 Tax=Vallitalea okinawensis TaxID=2078660 RepID=UPI000CFD8C3E|nr:sulfatase [Vallitalea okinawensis]
MRAIMLMFDSLNRHYLPNYGCDFTVAPNFKRLGEKTVTFDQFYAGSLPCMPARRELHTGRYNFLHRSWGPLEPYDDSMPEILKKNGIYTHLISDHPFYWADGGATYHGRYNTWEFERGQEGEPWKSSLKKPPIPEKAIAPQRLFQSSSEGDASYMWAQEYTNRKYMDTEEKFSQARVFKDALEFIEENKDEDQWFLQIEEFDPHEPYYTPERFRELYHHDYKGNPFDWPDHYMLTEGEEARDHIRCEYAALVSMCDHYLGKVLDKMDAYNMWEDTMLIVCTDHGFLLGEHDWWSKNIMPVYNEIAHIPFFIWNPKQKCAGDRRDALAQTIDIAPTILDFFDMEIPKDMLGKSLAKTIQNNEKIHDYVLYGYHGKQVNITDGRYVYMRSPSQLEEEYLYEYTLMPTHLRSRFRISELQDMSLTDALSFTKGIQCLKIKVDGINSYYRFPSVLYNVKEDPGQLKPIDDIHKEMVMIKEMVTLMKENDVQPEGFNSLGISEKGHITREDLMLQKQEYEKAFQVDFGIDIQWDDYAREEFVALMNMSSREERDEIREEFQKQFVNKHKKITVEHVEKFAVEVLPDDKKDMAAYFLRLLARRY